jgi:uncharacterized membrane protein
MEPQAWDPCLEVDADLVELVVVGLPEISALDQVATALHELVRLQAIRILDVVTLVKKSDGAVDVLEMEDVDPLPVLDRLAGCYGGLLSSRDLVVAADAVSPGTAAILLLVEDRWAAPISRAARSAGGQVLGGERVPRSRMRAALTGVAGVVDASVTPEGETHATHGQIT